MACRDLAKAQAAAGSLGISPDSVTQESIDLGSQASVRAFAARFSASGLPLHALVCNAAVYLPLLKQPARSPDRQREGALPFAQALSAKANDAARAARLWELSGAMVGLAV